METYDESPIDGSDFYLQYDKHGKPLDLCNECQKLVYVDTLDAGVMEGGICPECVKKADNVTARPWKWVDNDIIPADCNLGDADSILHHGADWEMKNADKQFIIKAVNEYDKNEDYIQIIQNEMLYELAKRITKEEIINQLEESLKELSQRFLEQNDYEKLNDNDKAMLDDATDLIKRVENDKQNDT